MDSGRRVRSALRAWTWEPNFWAFTDYLYNFWGLLSTVIVEYVPKP